MILRESPLRAEHERLGAKLVEFGGWEMPLSYPSGTIAEHLECRHGAVAFDVSHLGTVELEGPEIFERIQLAFSNDLRRIDVGRAQYTHLLDDDGSVLDDCIIWWRAAESFHVMPNASNTARVRDAIGGTDVTSSRALIAVQGPAARVRLATVASKAADVGRFHVGEFDFQGARCLVAGTGYTGEDGVECAVPLEVAPAFWRAVLEAGVLPAGLGARDTLRLEAGLPLHGHELGAGITPLQAGLSWVVGWDKDDFRGKAALVGEREAGVRRRLRGLVASGRRPPRTGDRCSRDGAEVGYVTSGNFSPVLGVGIALAFVDSSVSDGEVIVESRGTPIETVLTKPPFVAATPPPHRSS